MKKFLFGPWPISSSEIFYTSKHSFGLVNLKPVVPGHVLVISRRVCPRLTALTLEEVQDLMTSGQIIAREIEKFYKAESLTLTLQDGPSAGQSVPHVHLHIIPRRKGDWMDNDDIYEEIDKKELALGIEVAERGGDVELKKRLKKRGPDADRVARSQTEMAQEASQLRELFHHHDDIWSNKL